ncbi:hypothetical protein [Wolbachia pipientis]|uniref:hypothetical protein n=1 Tax=Wolbachia pipientis TaxID=955 RepID=UPI0025A35D8A|nr:hypothetical protein [Wolbachia pipientis]MDM8334802.1 hypothetical protein [Wolbachia pipientis]
MQHPQHYISSPYFANNQLPTFGGSLNGWYISLKDMASMPDKLLEIWWHNMEIIINTLEKIQ